MFAQVAHSEFSEQFLRSIGLAVANDVFHHVLPGKRSHEEHKKIVIDRSRTLAIGRCSVHLIPVTVSILIMVVNFKQVFIGIDFRGVIHSEKINLALLQTAAKLQELLIVASLATVPFQLLRHELISQDELWPTTLTANHTKIKSLSSSADATEHGVCPSGGYYSQWAQYAQVNLQTYQSPRPNYAKVLSGNNYYWAFQSASPVPIRAISLGILGEDSVTFIQPSIRVAITLDYLMQQWWQALRLEHGFTDLNVDDRSAVAAVPSPMTTVKCTPAQNLSISDKVVFFPGPNSPRSYLKRNLSGVLLANGPSQNARFAWVPPGDQTDTTNTSAIYQSPWTPDNRSRIMIGCTVQAQWVPTHIHTDAYSFWQGLYPKNISYSSNKPTEIRVDFSISGLSYRLTIVQDLAVAVLLLHILIARAHIVWILWRRESSDCWDSIVEFLVLAQNSRPAFTALRNTAAGIKHSRTFAKQVTIRPTRAPKDSQYDHLEMVYEGEADDGQDNEMMVLHGSRELNGHHGAPTRPQRVSQASSRPARRHGSQIATSAAIGQPSEPEMDPATPLIGVIERHDPRRAAGSRRLCLWVIP
ncbi:MAG: hypothetical protein Q9203_005507 [Teloschistes exilis]